MMKKVIQVWEWKDGFRGPINPNIFGAEVEKLSKKLKMPHGAITPASLVRFAENPESLIHPAFEWDDKLAAQKHREDQARLYLRSLRVEVVVEGEEDSSVRAFVNVDVKHEDKEEPAYVRTEVAAREPILREQMVADALRGLKGWQARYKELSGFSRVLALIDKAIAEAEKVLEQEKKDKPKD